MTGRHKRRSGKFPFSGILLEKLFVEDIQHTNQPKTATEHNFVVATITLEAAHKMWRKTNTMTMIRFKLFAVNKIRLISLKLSSLWRSSSGKLKRDPAMVTVMVMRGDVKTKRFHRFAKKNKHWCCGEIFLWGKSHAWMTLSEFFEL